MRVLEEAGAPRLGDERNSREWLRAALPAATRKLRHPGCHRYLFGIGTRAKRALPAGLPYPKVIPCLDP